MNMQRGRSNTAIIVVILILIVIIAMAYPWWRNRQIAEHVETAMNAADAAKVTVMEAATVQGSPARIKASDLGYNANASGNPYVANIEVADGGRITVTTKNTGADPDIRLLLTPTQGNGSDRAAIHWVCSVAAGNPDAAPVDCHNKADTTASPATTAPAATAPIAPAPSRTATAPTTTPSPSHSS